MAFPVNSSSSRVGPGSLWTNHKPSLPYQGCTAFRAFHPQRLSWNMQWPQWRINFSKILYFFSYLMFKSLANVIKSVLYGPMFFIFIFWKSNCGKKACRPNWFHSHISAWDLCHCIGLWGVHHLFLHILEKKKKGALMKHPQFGFRLCIEIVSIVSVVHMKTRQLGRRLLQIDLLECQYHDIGLSAAKENRCWYLRGANLFSCMHNVYHLPEIEMSWSNSTWVVYLLPAIFKEVCFRLLFDECMGRNGDQGADTVVACLAD